MKELVRLEAKKILFKPSVRFLFVLSMILIVVYFFLFEFGYHTVSYNYDTETMDVLSGFDAITFRKETAELFAGRLNEDTLNLMIEKLNAAKNIMAVQDENTGFSAMNTYRDQSALVDYLTDSNGNLKPIQEAYPNHSVITLGYCDGWDKMISSMGSILAILLCFSIITACSPVFAEEYSCHTDSILYSARYGRTKLVTAKIIASVLVMVSIYLTYLLLQLFLYGITYGFQGGTVNIQSSLHYASSTYNMTYVQLFIVSVLLNLCGVVTLTLITLCFSVKMRTPIAALLGSCLACFIPVLFDFNDTVPLIQKIQNICPIFMLHANGMFVHMNRYLEIKQPYFMFLFNLSLVLSAVLFIRLVSKKHQVESN